MSKKNLDRVRKAIKEVFGEFIAFKGMDGDKVIIDKEKLNRIVDEDTYTSKTDPGGWAPTAEVVVHCENGIPAGYYEPVLFEKWFEVSDKLGDLYCEHVNAAVIAIYRS